MLNAIFELGKTYIEKENLEEINILLDELKTTKSIILVEFELNDNNLKWTDVNLKEFSENDATNYLYKSGPPNGTNITPSALITESIRYYDENGKEKGTFNLKFFKWFKKEKSDPFINLFYEEIKKNKESILTKMEEIYNELDSKKNVLISISVKENDQAKYLNDFHIFQNHLKKVTGEKYYKMSSIKEEMKGVGECLICGEEKEVMGLVPNAMGFKFSNVDKPGNLQEINSKNQWKMVPICLDCALNLEAGKNFIDKYLSFSEFRLRYYAIPNFLFKKDDVIKELFDFYLNQKNEKSYYNTIAITEEILIKDLKDLDNVLEFKFFFYETKNSAFNILANVESVVPSWINNIKMAQNKIIKESLFEEDCVKSIFIKDDVGDFLDLINSKKDYNNVSKSNWLFGFLRDFYGFKEYNKFYISLVSAIFSGEKVSFDFIRSYALKKIRTYFKHDNEYMFKILTLELLLIEKLLLKLNLNIDYNYYDQNKNIKIKNIEENNMAEENNENVNQLDKFKEKLDSPSKRASFLLGILTRKLLSIQYKELSSTPFTNKLWGMSLDEKKIQKLYPMVINKLNEYKIAYTELSEEISQNLVLAEDNWKLNRDKTSYYFILGYTLFNLYDRPKKVNDNNESNDNVIV
ncbi:MAG: TIGR02556 family CRISPR-associated protein [Methanobrevibacter sp.]|jgi:CRISPR-associated protein Csh1|nr:TIGR02556 family CRISPR-associated protein [Candidatus Methanoflexus mossambicus]